MKLKNKFHILFVLLWFQYFSVLNAQNIASIGNVINNQTLEQYKDEDKPVLNSPIQIGDQLSISWASSKDSKMAFDVRLYEANTKGGHPIIIGKPIMAEIVNGYNYKIDGKASQLSNGKSYCFVITPANGLTSNNIQLSENSVFSPIIMWNDPLTESVQPYPTCEYRVYDIEVLSSGRDYLTFQWANPSDPNNEIVGYDITVRKGGGSNIILHDDTQAFPQNQYYIPNLDPETAYCIQIKIKCIDNVTSQKLGNYKQQVDCAYMTASACSAPPFSVNTATECGTEISWQTTAEASPTFLDIHDLETNISAWSSGINNATYPNSASMPLFTNKTYKAILEYECNQYPSVPPKYIEHVFEVKPAVGDFRVTELNPCQITVQWQNNIHVEYYKIKSTVNNVTTEYDLLGTNNNTYTFYNIIPNATYKIELLYSCNRDFGAPKVLTLTNVQVPPVCDVPKVDVVSVNNNTIKLIPREESIGKSLKVCYYTIAGGTQGPIKYNVGDVIPNISPSTDYIFYISYENCGNTCGPSSCSLNGVQTEYFTTPCPKPDNVQLVYQSSNSLKISWTPSNAATVGYRIKDSNSDWQYETDPWSGGYKLYTFFQPNVYLIPDTEYEFKVGYKNCTNESIFSAKTSATDECLGNPAKSTIKYTKIGKTSIGIIIPAFPFNNTYECEFKNVDDEDNWIPGGELNGGVDNSTLYNLSPGTTYNIRIRRWVPNGGTPCDWLLLDDVTTEDADCPPILLSSVQYETGEDFIKIKWTDSKVPKNYTLRYRQYGTTTDDWKEQAIKDITEVMINELLNNTVYELEIKRVCSTGNSDWVALNKQQTKTKVITSDISPTCGGNNSTPKATTNVVPPIDKIEEGYVLFYNGLKVKVLTIDGSKTSPSGVKYSDAAPYSGTAEMGLPFGKKKIKVTFSGVKVNMIQIITEGIFTAVSTPLSDDIVSSVFDLNSFTCDKPTPQNGNTGTGLSPTGFDSEGNYKGATPNCLSATDKKDPKRDPRGFDKDGNHVITNSKYDPNGCDVNGLKADKQPCACYEPCVCEGVQPYSWLNNNADVTQEGNALANKYKELLPTLLTTITTSYKSENDLKVTNTITECEGYRNIMNTQLGVLQYNRPLTYGIDDKYYKETMSKEFSKTPTFTPNESRKNGANLLDENHIKLFNCDGKLLLYKDLSLLLEQLLQNTEEKTKLSEYITQQTRTLSAEKAGEYTADKTKYEAWVTEQVYEYVKNLYKSKYGKDLGYNSNAPSMNRALKGFPDLELPEIPKYDIGLASTTFFDTKKSNYKLKDAIFQYEQGWEYIDGIHKSTFLDAITSAKQILEQPFIEDASTMPVSFEKTIAGVTFKMILDNLVFGDGKTSIDVYLIMKFLDGKKVAFKGTNLEFNGNGLISEPKLVLLTTFTYGINRVARLTLKADSTYATWDCEGFQSLHAAVDIEFCRDYVKPLDENGNVIEDAKKMVKLSTKFELDSWDEVIIKLAADKKMNFVLTGYEDYKISAQNIIIDANSKKVETDIKYPENYGSSDIQVTQGTAQQPSSAQVSPAWKGIYLGELSVKLPNNLFKADNGDVTVGVKDMIIDNDGVTGIIKATGDKPILALDNGNLSGWAYSINGIRLDILKNHIIGGGFNGRINVPIMSGKSKTDKSATITQDDCFEYDASYIPGQGKFTFTVKPATEKEFRIDFLKSKIELDQNSQISVVMQPGNVNAKAILNGKILFLGESFDAKKEDRKLDAFGIEFSGLTISTDAPHFKAGTFEIPTSGNLKFKGFGISYHVGKVNSYASDPDLGYMDLGVGFRLTEEKDNSDKTKLSANGGFQIFGKFELDANKRKRFIYQDFKIKTINIDGSFPGVEKLHGYITFFDQYDDSTKVNPKYGTGFQGGIDVKFSGIGITAKTVGLFGKVNDFKYFCIDAMVYSDKPIVTFGAISINGFGGGAYYHMSRDESAFSAFTLSKDSEIPTKVGKSLTGITYQPDISKSIGIRAMLGYALANSETAGNGNLLFGIEFNATGSLSEINLFGNLNVMSPAKYLPKETYKKDNQNPQTANVCASVELRMKFGQYPEFSCGAKVYMNVANTLVGKGEGGLLGDLSIYISKDKWYIYAGTPTNQIGLKMKSTLELELGTYFDIGSVVPDMPPLPQRIIDLTGATYKPLPKSARASGVGFAFGANFLIDTGDKTFMIFYGKFKVEAGFDVLVKKYEGVTCPNNNNEPLGINGWYAAGQLYASVGASIGLKWRKAKYEILNINAGLAFQARLPNPFWAQGSVGGNYKILGGLVKGKCNFQLTIGTECGSAVQQDAVPAIASITPSKNQKEVSVFTSPSIEFNYPIDGGTLEDDSEDPIVEYRLYIENIDFYEKSNNRKVKFIREADSYSGQTLNLQLKEILEGNTDYVVKVRCLIQKKQNYQWVEASSPIDSIITFTTGAGVDYIPDENCTTYPENGQFNFYRKTLSEGKYGLVNLRLDQSYLFKNVKDQIPVVHKARFVSNDGVDCIMMPLKYENNAVKFEVPQQLRSNAIYKIEIVTIPKLNEASQCVPDYQIVKVLRTISPVRVSEYLTLENKLNDAFDKQPISLDGTNLVVKKKSITEPFSLKEINGNSFSGMNFFTKSFFDINAGSAKIARLYSKLPIKINIAIRDYQYAFQFDIDPNDPTKGSTQLQASTTGERAVTNNDNSGTGTSYLSRELQVVQKVNSIPTLTNNFKTPIPKGTIYGDQYLSFTFEQGRAAQFLDIKQRVSNLKNTIISHMVSTQIFNNKIEAAQALDEFINNNYEQYGWINEFSSGEYQISTPGQYNELEIDYDYRVGQFYKIGKFKVNNK